MRWAMGLLPTRKCVHIMQHVDYPRGHCYLDGAKSPMQVWEYMVQPILTLMEHFLVKKRNGHLTGYLTNYLCFRMAPGMVNCCASKTFGTRMPWHMTHGQARSSAGGGYGRYTGTQG